MICRFCQAHAELVFLDLGTAPPSNAYLDAAAMSRPETAYPLKLRVCEQCWLVQAEEYATRAELFAPDYAYFSSYSSSWVEHAGRFVAQAVARLALGAEDLVVELASNDGYLLQHVQSRGIPCVGFEPTASTAAVARERGIETIEAFFGRSAAEDFVRERGTARLVVANNVLAHVPDVNDFVAGIAAVLAPDGVAALEFPHLLELVRNNQFDTVYHEHYSYFSFHAVRTIFARHGLRIRDVERLTTHGGSLRIWAARGDAVVSDTGAVARLEAEELAAGVLGPSFYAGFQARADRVKDDFVAFLIAAKRDGRRVAAYGAAAKGNTLLNYGGVRSDLLPFVVDASPHKQGRWLPGSRIPIVAESALRAARPDYIVVLPWNLRSEILAQLAYAREWGARFVTAVPQLTFEP